MRTHLLALSVLLVPVPVTAQAADDPAVCSEAIAAHPDLAPLEALEEAEKQRARQRRGVARESRRLAKEGLGSADGAGSRQRMRELGALEQRQTELHREAMRLCLCRERRSDPHREDCQQLYPQTLP